MNKKLHFINTYIEMEIYVGKTSHTCDCISVIKCYLKLHNYVGI